MLTKRAKAYSSSC